jgi:hypothetical protein
MADLRSGSGNWYKGHKRSGNNEASQRSAATFQNRIGKWEGTLGCRQGKGADDGLSAAKEDGGQKRALGGRRNGTR